MARGKWRKWLSAILTASMVLGSASVPAFAADTEEEYGYYEAGTEAAAEDAAGAEVSDTAEASDGAEAAYKDGTFEGTGDGDGGPIRVAVTIESDILTEVKVLSHDAEDPAYFVLAEGLTDRILSAQSTDVDAASGATFSSRGIISAVENALKEAVNEQ